ncbi:MAG: POTRA domain-containing protein [Planctomycetaceae bacterium]
MALLNRVHRVLGNDARPRRTPRLSEGLLALAVPVALWAGIATVGPALAQEEPVEAPKTEATVDDVVEEAYRDFDVRPGKSPGDMVEGLAQNDGFGSSEDGFTDSPNGELYEALRELRQELKALRSEVEELRDAKGEPRARLPVVHKSNEDLWRDYIAAIKARDEAYGRILLLEKSQAENPAYERFAQERYREAENHLAELHQHIEQVDPRLFERFEGESQFRVVTDIVESEDGKTRQFKRLVPIDAKLDEPSDDRRSSSGKFPPETRSNRESGISGRRADADFGSADEASVTQIRFTGPAGMTISGRDPHTGHHWKQSAPARHFFPHNWSYDFNYSEIPGRKGLKLNARLQLLPTSPIAEKFLSNNAVPIELTDEDLDQAAGKNHVTKVIYLPKAEHRVPISPIRVFETLVSTRLDPGVDPIAEGFRRGQVVAVLNIVRHPLPLPKRKLVNNVGDPEPDDAWTKLPAAGADLSANDDDSLPAEVTGKDGRRYRAVTELFETVDGKKIQIKRYVPADQVKDEWKPNYLDPEKLRPDDDLKMKYKAAGLVRDAAVRELVEAKKQKQNPDVLEHLQKNVDEAQRWLNQLHEELQERQEVADGASKEIHLRALNPPVTGTPIGLPGPPHLPAAKPYDGRKETTSDKVIHSLIDGPGPGVLGREQAKSRDGKSVEIAPEIKKLVEEYRQAVKSRDEAARLAASEAQSTQNLAHSQNRLVEAQRELERVQAELERRKILAGLPVGELKPPGDDEPQEASAEVKQLVEEYLQARRSRDEAARLAASEAAKGVAPSQKRLVEAQRELARLQAELERRKILVGLPVDDAVPADDGLPDEDSLRVVSYRVGDLIASGSHVKKPVTGMLDTLVNLITRSVRPSSWEQAGGQGRIEKAEKELRLLIVQTEDAHDEIKDLLKSLQKLQRDGAQDDSAPASDEKNQGAAGGSSTRSHDAPTHGTGDTPVAPGDKPPLTDKPLLNEDDRLLAYRQEASGDLVIVEPLPGRLAKSFDNPARFRNDLFHILSSLGGGEVIRSVHLESVDGREIRLRLQGKDGRTGALVFVERDGRLLLDRLEPPKGSEAGKHPAAPTDSKGAAGGSSTRADAPAHGTGDTPVAPSAESKQIAAALDEPISLHVVNTPLEDVIEIIRSHADVNVVFDKAGLDEEGVAIDTPITIGLDDVRISSALQSILHPLSLGVVFDDEVLTITSLRKTKGPLLVETYSIGDLVLPKAKRIEVLGGRLSVELTPEIKTQSTARFKTLLDLITGTIEPNSWEQVGGWGVIRQNATTLSLVIRQTRDVHDEIYDLLEQLRRLQRGEPAADNINRKHYLTPESVPSGEKPGDEAKQGDNAIRELGKLISEYNELIKQRNYAEAITIARKIRELNPENEAAVTMLYKAKVLYEDARQASDPASPHRRRETEALLDSTLEIQPAPDATGGLPTRADGPSARDTGGKPPAPPAAEDAAEKPDDQDSARKAEINALKRQIESLHEKLEQELRSDAEEANPLPKQAFGPIESDGMKNPLKLLDVRVEGNSAVPTKEILEEVDSSPGERLSSDRVAEDTQALLRTHRFLSVTPRITSADGGVVVTFLVVERPLVKQVAFRGNETFQEDDLSRVTGITKDGPYGDQLFTEAARRLEAFYHERGFSKAKVEVLQSSRPGVYGVVFDITEGDRVDPETNERTDDGALLENPFRGAGQLFRLALDALPLHEEPQRVSGK